MFERYERRREGTIGCSRAVHTMISHKDTMISYDNHYMISYMITMINHSWAMEPLPGPTSRYLSMGTSSPNP